MFSKIRSSILSKIMLAVLSSQFLLPLQQGFALTGGPSQPEFKSFTPAGVNDMVDLFSGDFQYNIPLLDVEGYPINLSYSSGIGMEDQASCVGLGWTLNAAGMINRAVRGIPDDFDGSERITTTTNYNPNWTFGVNFSIGNPEIIGKELPLGMSLKAGILYNNYTGIGQEMGVGVSHPSILGGGKMKMGGSLNLGLSTDNGITVSPTLGLDFSIGKNKAADNSMFDGSLSIGTPYNSRSGLRQVTIGVDMKTSAVAYGKYTKDAITGEKTVTESVRKNIGSSTGIPIGLASYLPQNTAPMDAYSISGNLGVGLETFWANAKGKIEGYFSHQSLSNPVKSSPAYGYLYSGKAANSRDAMHDFNREKDGAFNQKVPALAMTQMTYDIYTASGQGVSGMFRPHRDFGTVYDPYTYSVSGGGSIGMDIGAAAYFKGGVNASGDFSSSTSGKWSGGNNATTQHLSLRDSPGSLSTYEPAHFKNAGDIAVFDDSYFKQIQEFDPVRIQLDGSGGMNNNYLRRNSVSSFSESNSDIADNTRQHRVKRNQVFSFLTAEEASKAGLEMQMFNYKYDAKTNKTDRIEINRVGDGREKHHLSEITVTKPDGSRYVYGTQTYNYKQKEATFNVEGNGIDHQAGLVSYGSKDASSNNNKGIDHFYNSNELPAHATAYLLTAVLSADYIDAKGDGLTDDDFGNYTKFNYTQVYDSSNPYKWRNPYNANQANFQAGLRVKKSDDKGTYIYGEKEIKMLHSIETKNNIAEFIYSKRDDAYDVQDERGGRSDSRTLYKLDAIKLYNKNERNTKKDAAVPLKTVHFDYDYSLCRGILSSIDLNSHDKTKGGKLTLKKVYFTFGNSRKGALSPYEFTYGYNPDYDARAQDRWGNYKPNPTVEPYNIDAPYVTQHKDSADQYAAAWTLIKIQLPSGGTINAKYESDDYAYIQNRRAANMFKIVGFAEGGWKNKTQLSKNLFSLQGLNIHNNNFVYVETTPNAIADENDFRKKCLGKDSNNKMKELFYRCYVDLSGKGEYDYIMGYAEIDIEQSGWSNGLGWIKLNLVRRDDNYGGEINPIAKTAMQYVLLNASDLFYGGNRENKGELEVVLRKMAGLITDILAKVQGQYHAMASRDMGREVDTTKSFVRLMTTDYNKLGGGLRVKELSMSDNWATMTNEKTAIDAQYGQTYKYTTTLEQDHCGIPKGTEISSGVATYEPFIGNEENPWRESISYVERNNMAPDNQFYQERPYGEMFFPSPSVGYSKVTVTNLQHENVTRTASGYAEHEFYTAKDFPVIVREPYKGNIYHDKPSWINKLLKVSVKDHITVSQSYAIELNDMHGKQKSQKVFGEGQTEPVSSVEYFYKQEGSGKLSNNIKTINDNGRVSNALAGIDIDMTFDERENASVTIGGSVDGNLDVSPIIFGIPLPIPSFWPGAYSEETRFRSITSTKVITRYGILERTMAQDLGSHITTTNMAWDAETGDVLLTETQNNFGDPVYSFTYPSHWGYEGMAPAYKNIGVRGNVNDFNNIENASSYFSLGDEVLAGNEKGWVTAINGNGVSIKDREGSELNGGNITIVRSGRRNQQGTPMGSVTSLGNPIANGQTLNFSNARVVNAGAVEFNDNWGASICGEDAPEENANPYTTGALGNYRPQRSWVYLTERTQSDKNRNSNLRRDGVFTRFSPFWQAMGGAPWRINSADWTSASEVTMFSPYGFELENRDALGRYTAATYGYNNTLPTAVSANAQYKEIISGNAEDKKETDNTYLGFENADASENQSHTGKNSIKVTRGTTVKLHRMTSCEK
ncbi:MAG: hypothetical protein LBR81_09825 [Prevotellaceae bacterium]|jgi:hypothetical protein|nr:hypothetical protein [Prevotellaceae bacterium]